MAIDDNHDVSTFTANPKEVTTVSVSTRLTVALVSCVELNLMEWNGINISQSQIMRRLTL